MCQCMVVMYHRHKMHLWILAGLCLGGLTHPSSLNVTLKPLFWRPTRAELANCSHSTFLGATRRLFSLASSCFSNLFMNLTMMGLQSRFSCGSQESISSLCPFHLIRNSFLSLLFLLNFTSRMRQTSYLPSSSSSHPPQPIAHFP